MNIQRRQTGFTLIELIAVIVILGILAAVALPKFVGVTQEARISSVNGLAGGLRSSVAMVKSKYLVGGSITATSVTMDDGSVVSVSAGTTGGIPTGAAAGIGRAIQDISGFTAVYNLGGSSTFQPDNGGSATCGVTYNDTNGVVTATTTGC